MTKQADSTSDSKIELVIKKRSNSEKSQQIEGNQVIVNFSIKYVLQ